MNLGRIFSLAALLPLTCFAISPNLVISHVYGAGGNSGASRNADFVVLFNRGNTPASLAGHTVQYAAATGTGNFGQAVSLPATDLAPGKYFLIGMTPGANGAALPQTDATGTISMAAGAGKIALVNSTSNLPCNGGSTVCTPEQRALIVDLVGYGNANFFEGAAGAPTLNASTQAVRAGNGCTDTDNNSADFATATLATIPNSATAAAVCGGPVLPSLTISDVTLAEGNAGTTAFNFTVQLSAAAGAGGVTFDIATANNTAVAPGDYTSNSVIAASIPAGGNSYSFTVLVNGDAMVEGSETFFVNITNPSANANIGDGQAIGTIQNDDVTLVTISTVQGSGVSSPLNGASVSVQGVVTARISNGFFIQDSGDGNPATSDGIFIFTSSTPTSAATVGNIVQVTGTVTEFSPSTDPNSPPTTELISPTVVQVSAGNPLPTPVIISPAMVTANGGISQLEHLEGMYVSIANLRAVAPTSGSVSEASATSTSTGVFYGVMPGVATPFREAGIETPNPVPVCAAGSGCAIPIFDQNPERIRVDSDAAGQAPVQVGVGQTVSGLTGVLHYGFRAYSVLPTTAPTVSGTPVMLTPTAVPGSGTVTVAAMNVERLFDTVDDPGVSDVAVTPTALSNRLGKISKTIRDVLRTPDVISLEEAENLGVAQALAARISSDAAAASQPDPGYTAYLVEGNDIGGIDVGFLVKNTVQVTDVTQLGLNTTYINPCNGNPEILNDRPPLRLRGTSTKGGNLIAFTVYANHLRSLNDIDSVDPCAGSTTGGRVRAKRAAQANFLAQEIQAELTSNPVAKILAVGDFNAFEVNDGYADVLNAIIGSPAPSTQVATATNNPAYADFTNLLNLLPVAQRYSYVFDGNHQTLDHALLSPAARAVVVGGGYARVNAEFPDNLRSDPSRPERYSDHDPVVVQLTAAPDVTPSLTVSRGGAVYNRPALTATMVVNVRNNTANTVSGPLSLVVSGLPAGVTVTNAASNNGAAYVFNLPAALAPGQSTTVQVAFSLSAIQPITFAASIFQGTL